MSELVNQFHFLRPLWLLATIPILFLWWRLYRGRDPRLGLSDDIAPHLLDRLVTSPTDQPWFRPVTMILPLALVAIFAIAGPSYRQQPSPLAQDKSQLMLIVKVTPSMLTEDLQPTRLERVRTKIHDLLETRKGADTGLIAYSGSAHLVMPATPDGEVIDHMLESLDPSIMPTEGDSLASALQIAAEQLSDKTSPGSLLVVADSVQQTEMAAIGTWRQQNQVSVQILVPLRDDAALQRSGVPEAASALGASVHRISPDDQDINAIASAADRAIVALTDDESTQWRDDGYWLVPIMAIGVLYWCRRGWSISSD
jgi:Ca-activated chloride channel family protein